MRYPFLRQLLLAILCALIKYHLTPAYITMLRLSQLELPRRLHTVSKSQQYEHFFRYTSGRWLWDEEKQLHDRYKKFNVDELQRIAAESIGAKRCVSMTKLAEGGYNKVFRLVMDNGSIAIARIPCRNAGPAFKTTASEVATMDFVRCLHVSIR